MSDSNAPMLEARQRGVVAAAAIVVVCVGLAGFVGARWDLPFLTTVAPGAIAIKVNASICLALLGLSLWIQRSQPGTARIRVPRLAAKLLATIAALVGLLSLGEILFGWDLGIDQAIAPETDLEAFGSLRPGLMSPIAAVDFVLLGIALVLLDWGKPGLVLVLSFGAGALALFSVLDLMLAPRAFHTHIAPQTAVALCVLSLVVLRLRPEPRFPRMREPALGAGSLVQLLYGGSDARWRQYWPVRYGVALLAVAIGVVLTDLLRTRLHLIPPFIVFNPVVIVVVIVAGLGPAMLAIWSSAVCAAFFLMEPVGLLQVAALGDAIALALFVSFASTVCWLLAATQNMLTHTALYTRSLIEASLDPLLTLDREGAITDVNAAMEAVTGVPRAQLIGSDFSQYLTQPDEARRGYQQAFALGSVCDYPLVLRHASGKLTDVLYNATVFRNAEGAVAGVFAAARDVTERNQVEQRLRESEKQAKSAQQELLALNEELDERVRARAAEVLAANELLETILDNMPSLVFVKEAPDFRYVRINRACEVLMDRPRAELLGKTDRDLFPPDQAAGFNAKDQEALSGTVLVDVPIEQVQGKHGVRLLHARKLPLPEPSGPPRYVLVIADDITDTAELDQARARLAAIVRDSDDAIIGRTLDGIVTSWNPGAERLFGFSADEMIGQHMSALYSSPHFQEEEQLTQRILAGDHIANFQTVRTRKDGREFEVSVTLSPVRDAAGVVIGTSKIARDITALKNFERELVRAKEATEAINRELEAFSYSIAHDLRAPLRSIDGFSQALLEDCSDALDEQGRKYLTSVRESARLMAQLIEDILALSRVGRSELICQAVDLSALARTVCQRLQRAEPDRQVELVIPDGLTGAGDPRLLAVVLDNLLGNAWKFTGKRSDARIELGGVESRAAGVPSYFVRDNGAGFDMAYVNKLFGVFQRLHSSHEFPGTGVGLAIVQRIVHRHGGQIWAEGEVGVGATFHFTLGAQEISA